MSKFENFSLLTRKTRSLMTVFAIQKLMNHFNIQKPSQLYYQFNKINEGNLPEVFQFGSNAFNKKARGQPFSVSTLNIIDMYKPGILDLLLHPFWLSLDFDSSVKLDNSHPIIRSYISTASYNNRVLINGGINDHLNIWRLDRHVNFDSMASALILLRQRRITPWYCNNIQRIICNHIVALCSSDNSLYKIKELLIEHVYELFKSTIKIKPYDGFPSLDGYYEGKYVTFLPNHLLEQIEESIIYFDENECAKYSKGQRISKAQFIYHFINSDNELNPLSIVKGIKVRRSRKHSRKQNLEEFSYR